LRVCLGALSARPKPRGTVGFHQKAGLTASCSYALQRTIPSVRGAFTPLSPHRSSGRGRNVDRLSIGIGFRLSLRPRLTLIRLTLIRNPWATGGRGFHPPYRYLCLHLLFRKLHRPSRGGFGAGGMLPYHVLAHVHSFGGTLDARLLSTRSRSTSELLRTL